MRSQILKSLLLVLSVTSILSCKAQVQNEVNDSIYYRLITDLVSQDTLVPEWRNRIIQSKIENGQLTQEDGLKYYNAIKNRRFLVFNKKIDLLAKDALTKDLEDGHYLERHLSFNKISKVIKRFPNENGFHDITFVLKGIELVDKFSEWQRYHKFSSPVWVEKNKYIIFHYKSIGRFNYGYCVVLFSLDKADYVIEQEITLKRVVF